MQSMQGMRMLFWCDCIIVMKVEHRDILIMLTFIPPTHAHTTPYTIRYQNQDLQHNPCMLHPWLQVDMVACP